jgi:transposase
MTTKRKHYTKEFKREAVRLLEQGEKPPADIARELGIKRNQLYKWQDEVHAKGEGAFPGSGRQAPAEAELARLKRENERLQEEVEILKKAAKYFARESE